MNNTLHNLNKKSRLKTKLELVPDKPGVYLHKNAQNEILYVGKAKNLKNRLKSYFNVQVGRSSKTQSLIENIDDFDFIVTQNEYESLIAENNLIKHHKPHYNILLKDNKTYPYLRINLRDKWPQLIFTRRKKTDGALYFGPYPNAGSLYRVLNVIHKFFPLVRCSPQTFKTVTRPCHFHQIGQCLAPCHLHVDHAEYMEIVNRVVALLNGKTKDIITKITVDMKQASKDLNFEKAAKLRDSILALESISDQQSVDLDSEINIDFISFIATKEYFVFYVSYVRNGRFVGANSYVNTLLDDTTTTEDLLTSLFIQYYDSHESSENIFFFDDKQFLTTESKNYIAEFITEKYKIAPVIYTDKQVFFKNLKIKKENKNKLNQLMDMCVSNAQYKIEEKIKIDSSAADKLIDVQNLLGLPRIPQWIECYDISTFQGTATVGSRVVFKNGMPFKSMYRKYIIRDFINKMDDFAGLKEVLRRRFKDRHVENIDLVMVDGGTPQVREVAYLFKSLGLENIPFLGIAKQRTTSNFKDSHVQMSKERLVIPARDENHQLLPGDAPHVIELDPHSKAYQVLVSLRDEAHRFAITFHRKRRDKMV